MRRFLSFLDPRGRIPRSPYWHALALCYLILLPALYLGFTLLRSEIPIVGRALLWICLTAISAITIIVVIKRTRDINASAWWVLAAILVYLLLHTVFTVGGYKAALSILSLVPSIAVIVLGAVPTRTIAEPTRLEQRLRSRTDLDRDHEALQTALRKLRETTQ